MKSIKDYILEAKTEIPETVKRIIKQAMSRGYISHEENGKTFKYGISRENILDCIDLEEINTETVERFIKQLERDGIKFKYETNKEWKKAGLKDPNED